jgi:alkanesulfonate monooxygenase SsuD/methylene tetrahydromethanopterin reductase-like flavin-dependent oxidoreductase (luciferase family)
VRGAGPLRFPVGLPAVGPFGDPTWPVAAAAVTTAAVAARTQRVRLGA